MAGETGRKGQETPGQVRKAFDTDLAEVGDQITGQHVGQMRRPGGALGVTLTLGEARVRFALAGDDDLVWRP